MAKKIFNQHNNIDIPTLLLQNRHFETIGIIKDVHNLTYKESFNSPDELTFNIYKNVNKKENPIWNDIKTFKIIYVPEFREKFEINSSTILNNTLQKSIQCTSLCESELSQIKLYNIEINTQDDILNDDYDVGFPTVFYRNPDNIQQYDWSNNKYKNYSNDKKKEVLRKSSLLHRILEKAEHYTIGTVSNSLMNLQREFSISDTDIYSELTGEISEEFNCIFQFDSMTRTISAYDLHNTCLNCGYRGDFTYKCPECESTNFSGQYGEDTTVFISNENLAEEISLESNKDSLKNCFYIEGGDETITAAIRSINPNGTNYIYDFNEDTKHDMPKELSSTLDSYDRLYKEYFFTKNFELNSVAVNNYNTVVDEINSLFQNDSSINFLKLSKNIVGYSSIIKSIYETTDFYGFLKDSMMPTIRIDGLGLEDSLQNILTGFREGFSTLNEDGSTTQSFQNQIAIRDHTTAIESSVKNAIQKSAKLYYNTAYYDLEINTLNYTPATSSSHGTWNGTFTLKSLSEKNPETGENLQQTSPHVTLTIVDHVELYLEQSIYKKMTKDKSKYSEITSLQMEFNTFKNKVSLYSYNELMRLKDSFQACLDVIITANISDKSLYTRYFEFYSKRVDYIDKVELLKREQQIKCIQKLYFFDLEKYEASGILADIKSTTNNVLNFKEYIISNPLKYNSYNGEDLWKTFCSYRREDKYTNSNYISDGLNNAEIIENAKKLLDVAKKELYKASNLQYSLSTNMENLIALKEFQPLIESFSCGNWIRIEMDDEIYKLRLLSYKINFDEISSIDVEFSTVEKLWTGNSDIKSIIESAKSIASSYSYITQQVKQSNTTTKYVNDWVDKGFSATATKIVNDCDNQSITLDRNGILCREYDDIQDVYNPFQARFINNGLYITTDNWKTVKAALGKFIYTLNNVEKVAYGLLAETIVGKFIIGENLLIQNSSGDLSFDSNGLLITNGISTVTINPNNKDKLFKISDSNSDLFYTNSNGDLVLSGTITAKYGSKIGNLFVGENKLTYGNFGIDTSITEPGNTALWLGKDTPSSAPFRVTYGGKLYAEDADIRGKILSTSGKIGGFTIGASYLANNTTALGTTANSVYLGTDGISCGNNFKIDSNGNAIAKSLTVNGGEISGAKIKCGNFFTIYSDGRLETTSKEIISTDPQDEYYNHYWLSKTELKNGEITLTRTHYNANGTIYNNIVYNTVIDPYGEIRAKGRLIISNDAGDVFISSKGEVFLLGNVKASGTIYENGTALSNKYQAKGSYAAASHTHNYAAASHTHSYLPLSGGTLTGNLVINNARALQSKNSSGTLCQLLILNSGNNYHIGPYVESALKPAVFLHGEGSQYDFLSGIFRANKSNTIKLGDSSHLWQAVYAKNGTIQTSDRTKKHDIQDIPDKYIELFYKLIPRIYMLNGGDRIHVGVISQEVENAMETIGINAAEFGGFCKDIRYEYEHSEDGCEIESTKKPATDRYGNIIYDYSIRYQEFIFMHIEATHRLKKEVEEIKQLLARQNERIQQLEKENEILKNSLLYIQ